MAWEKLTTTNIVQLIGGVGAVILAGVIGFFLNASLKADLRYEEGQFYRSGSESIVSLKIHNYGYSDAKDIFVATNFPKPLVKLPASSDDTYPCSVVAGGKGENSVSVSVNRLVPDQSLYLYYSIEDPKKPISGDKDRFVSSMTYAGGQGKDGPPFSISLLATLILSLFMSILSSLIAVKIVNNINKMANQRVQEARTIAKGAVEEAGTIAKRAVEMAKQTGEESHNIAKGAAEMAKQAAEESHNIAKGAAEEYHKNSMEAAKGYREIATDAADTAKEIAREALGIAAKAEADVRAISAEKDELRRQLDQLNAASGGAPAGKPDPVSQTSAARTPPPVAPKPKKK